jgi:hypothetical protein
MDIAMAGAARLRSENSMNAFRQIGDWVSMAAGAPGLGNRCRMGKILDSGVAIATAEDRVRASSVFLRVNEQAPAFLRFQIRLAVAG